MYVHVCHECISYMYMYSRCYLRIFFYIPVYYILSATVIIYPACTVYQSVMVSSEFFIHQQMQFSFFRKPRRPEHTKVRRIHMQFINMWMAQNPEMTAANIQGRLEKQCGIQLSKEYVCMLRRKLNWTPKHMKYGQLISHKNVKHRLDWCLDQLISKESFVMWYMWTSQQWRCVLRDDFFSTGMDPTWIDYQLRHPNQSTHIKLMCGAAYRTEEEQVSVYFLE